MLIRFVFRFRFKKFGFEIFSLIFLLNWIISRKSICNFNWGLLFSTFHVNWKSESVTNGPTDGHLTWVGARDTCVSKNCTMHVTKRATAT